MNQDTFTEKTFVFIQIWLKKGNSPTVQSHYHHSCCWASGLSPSESCSLQQPGPAVAADAWPHCHWGLQCPHYSWAYLLSVSGLGSKCLYFGLQLSGGWGDRRICCMLEITSLWPPPHPLEATKSPAPSSELQQCMSVEWWNRTAAVCYVVWSDVQLS